MGLDMFIFSEKKEKNKEEVYWRKDPAIHQWFKELADSKNIQYDSFNGIQVPLTKKDIKSLIKDMRDRNLKWETSGFFFGSNNFENKEEENIWVQRNIELLEKLLTSWDKNKVYYYNSWW